MEACRLLLWVALCGVRCLAVLMFGFRGVADGELGCGLIALVELQALVLAIVNERGKEATDRTWQGLIVPCIYLSGMFTAPVGVTTETGQVSMSLVALAVFYCQCNLGKRFSLGGSTWVNLCDRGPYRWVRHPMLLCLIVARLVIVAEFPSTVNFITLGLFLVGKVLTVVLEERFLMTFAAYREYCQRVPYRLAPLVW